MGSQDHEDSEHDVSIIPNSDLGYHFEKTGYFINRIINVMYEKHSSSSRHQVGSFAIYKGVHLLLAAALDLHTLHIPPPPLCSVP